MLETLNLAIERSNAGDSAAAVRLAISVAEAVRADPGVAAALEAIGSAAIAQVLAEDVASPHCDDALEAASALVSRETACRAWCQVAAARLNGSDANSALLAACFAIDADLASGSALALFAECAARAGAPDVAAAVAAVVRPQATNEGLITRLDDLIAGAARSRLVRFSKGDEGWEWKSSADLWRLSSPPRFILGKVMAASGTEPAWGGLYDLAHYFGHRGSTDLAIQLFDTITRAIPDFGMLELAYNEWLQKTGQFTLMIQRRVSIMARLMTQLFPPQPAADAPWSVDAAQPASFTAAIRSIESHGLVALRQAIDPAVIAETIALLFTDQPNRDFVDPGADIPPALLQKLVTPILRQIVEHLNLIGPDAGTSHGRQISPSPSQRKDAVASQYHQDATVFFQPLINLWIPLDACGQDAPGLALLRDATRTVFPTRHREEFKLESCVIDDLSIEKLKQQHTEIIPILAVGDVLMFLGTVPHRTYLETHMTKARRSIELRFVPSGWLVLPMPTAA